MLTIRAILARNRDFSLLWTSQLLSMTGWQVSLVAFPLLVLDVTRSPSRAGLVTGLGYFTFFVYLPAGILVDQMDRKTLMVIASLGEGVGLLLVPIALLLRSEAVVLIAAMAIVQGVAMEIFAVAEQAALIHLVDNDLLADAVNWNLARDKLAILVGPVIGGSLYTFAHGLPFIAAGAIALMAAGLISLIRAKTQEVRVGVVGARPRWGQIADGLRWIWAHPFFRAAGLAGMAGNVMSGAIDLVLILRAREDRASGAAIGVMIGLMGFGGLVGSLIAGKLRASLSVPHLIQVVFGLQALALPLCFLSKNPYYLGLVAAIAFVGGASVNSAVVSARLLQAPDIMRGRIGAANRLISSIGLPFSVIIIGLVLESAGSTIGLLCLVVWQAFVAIWLFLSRDIRRGPEPA